VRLLGRNVGRRMVVAESSCSRMGVERRLNRSRVEVTTALPIIMLSVLMQWLMTSLAGRHRLGRVSRTALSSSSSSSSQTEVSLRGVIGHRNCRVRLIQISPTPTPPTTTARMTYFRSWRPSPAQTITITSASWYTRRPVWFRYAYCDNPRRHRAAKARTRDVFKEAANAGDGRWSRIGKGLVKVRTGGKKLCTPTSTAFPQHCPFSGPEVWAQSFSVFSIAATTKEAKNERRGVYCIFIIYRQTATKSYGFQTAESTCNL